MDSYLQWKLNGGLFEGRERERNYVQVRIMECAAVSMP